AHVLRLDMLIKKYKNRRLYNTETSQYITLDDVRAYVLAKQPFKVVEASTDKDMTSTTLLQIIVELEAGQNPLLSNEVLRQLIVLAEHPMSKSFKSVLEQFFASLQNPVDD